MYRKQVEEIASGANTSQRFYEVAQEEIMGGTVLDAGDQHRHGSSPPAARDPACTARGRAL